MNLSRPLIRVVRSSLQFRSQNCLFRCLSWNALKLSRPLVRVVKSSLQFRCQKLSISMFILERVEIFTSVGSSRKINSAISLSKIVYSGVVNLAVQFFWKSFSGAISILGAKFVQPLGAKVTLERGESFTSSGSSRKIKSAISLSKIVYFAVYLGTR